MRLVTYIADSEEYSPQAIAAYRKLGPVFISGDFPKKDLPVVLAKANILVLRLATKVTQKLVDQMPRLKVVAVSTTGLNHINTDYLRKKKVKLISLRGRSGFLKDITSTAEKTMALMLASVRKLPWAFEHVKSGGWNRTLFRGNQLVGKTLGLVGFGRLGKLVAKYARAFGMSVIAHDPYVTASAMAKRGVRAVALREVFKRSDIVSIHASLTEETRDMINKSHFRLMRSSAHLINTARGELMDERDLLRALKENWLSGAALDVLRDESQDGVHLENNPLIEYARANNNLLIVPHIGGATIEAMTATEDFIADLVTKHVRRYF